MSDTKTSTEPKYPEAEKWAKIHSDVVAISGFIEWQQDRYDTTQYMPPLQTQLYEYFEIDANKLEQERSAMIASLR